MIRRAEDKKGKAQRAVATRLPGRAEAARDGQAGVTDLPRRARSRGLGAWLDDLGRREMKRQARPTAFGFISAFRLTSGR